MKQRSIAKRKQIGSAAARAGSLARTLVGRHARMHHAAPLDAVLLRRAAPLHTVNATQLHMQVSIAPRLQLTLASNSSAPVAPRPAHTVLQNTETTFVTGPSFFSSVLEPIRLRSERVDTLRELQQVVHASAAAQPVAATTAPAQPPQARIERVYCGASRATAQAQRNAPAAQPAPSVPGLPTTQTTPSAARPAAVPELDIGRLADRVVHAIDRRLVAQRERHGRI